MQLELQIVGELNVGIVMLVISTEPLHHLSAVHEESSTALKRLMLMTNFMTNRLLMPSKFVNLSLQTIARMPGIRFLTIKIWSITLC